VLQQPQQLDLPQNARGVRHMLKHVVDLLDRDLEGGGRRQKGRGTRGALAAFAA
jgi:hypothetical protein